MRRFMGILKKIFFLPPLPTVLIAVPSFSLCFFLLAAEYKGILSYAAYVLSAYALTVTVTGTPRIINAVRDCIYNHPIAKKALGISAAAQFVDDAGFRTKISLFFGFALNLIYIGIKLFSGIYYRSAWFIALAVYYILLALMRFMLLQYIKKNPPGSSIRAELHRYRFCGIVLLIMNQALTGIVILIVHQNKGFEYSGLLIYAMAAYTFYITVTAIINTVKYRKHGSPVLSAAKAVNLVAAIVSMLSLTTAMLSSFDNGDPIFRRNMTRAAGAGVCVIVLAIAVFMTIRSYRLLKRMNAEEDKD